MTAEMANIPYRQAVGSLMYLAVPTRPDLSYAVDARTQFNYNPGPDHWVAVKRVLRYLRKTF